MTFAKGYIKRALDSWLASTDNALWRSYFGYQARTVVPGLRLAAIALYLAGTGCIVVAVLLSLGIVTGVSH